MRIKGVSILSGQRDTGATALSLSGAARMHNVPRPKPRGIRGYFGSKRSGGGELQGAASQPVTILSGVTDKT